MANTRTEYEEINVSNRDVIRLLSKTIKAESGCLIWVGCIDRNGYGAFKLKGKKVGAHVASWRLHNNGSPVPVGKLVMHKCDCRVCVNPEHLVVGTSSENMRDAVKKGRLQEFRSRGESHPGSVLTEDLVRRIREMHKPRIFGARRIARFLAEYGVTESAVSSVLSGENWKHVE